MTTALRTVHAPAATDWRTLDPDALLALSAAPLPWDVRWALVNDRLVVLATTAGTSDDAWLRRTVAGTAAGAPLAEPTAADGDADALLATVRRLTASKSWRLLDAEEPGLRLAVPGEHDLPPIAVRSCPGGLRVERPLPLLPARDVAPLVRLAVAHATLTVNGLVRAARIVVRDPRQLTFGSEFDLRLAALPDEDASEEWLEHALEGVRHATVFATGVLDCLRNPAVASAYATAHRLAPAMPPDREHHA